MEHQDTKMDQRILFS